MSNPSSTANDTLFVANRLGYGPRADEFDDLSKQSVKEWLDAQLAAPEGEEPEVEKRLSDMKLHIKYDAVEGKYGALDEMRGLTALNQPTEELWGALFAPDKPVSGAERGRPRLEVIMAVMMRAAYAKYQLREVMSQFWHDHFHVNAFADDHIAVALPAYDRDVIRKNSFGNFRTMLEDVATSTAMQYYLSNHSSRAGSANENYARELFELHTFGAENYLNDHYDRWRDVPGALQGHPSGYIDQDVYEAARAFTGWTVEDGGQIDAGRKLPATGKFTYVENWHDGYQKRVLATEFDPFAPPMADGRKVLDLIASHPGTAKHMATKLCVRLAGPNPPESLTSRASELWLRTVNAPDQIAQMIRFIVSTPEFMQSRGTKVKRPLALMANYVRVMNVDFTPSEGLFNQLSGAGQRLFGAPTPTGLPDNNTYFLGSNAMRNRWSLIMGLAQNWWQTGMPDAAKALEAWGGKTGDGRESVTEWFRVLGLPPEPRQVETTMVAAGLMPFAPVTVGNADDNKHLTNASAIAAMAPAYQVT